VLPGALVVAVCMARLFRFVGYNPMDVLDTRATDVAEALYNQDAMVLIGTKLRGRSVQDVGCVAHRTHNEFRFGWNYGKHTNRSTGVSVVLRKRRFPHGRVTKFVYPYREIMGRVGAILCGYNPCITICRVYFPVRPNTAAEALVYNETDGRIYEWVMHRVAPLAAKGLVILHANVNSDFGRPRAGWFLTEDELAVAPVVLGGEEEATAATYMRKIAAAVGGSIVTACFARH